VRLHETEKVIKKNNVRNTNKTWQLKQDVRTIAQIVLRGPSRMQTCKIIETG